MKTTAYHRYFLTGLCAASLAVPALTQAGMTVAPGHSTAPSRAQLLPASSGRDAAVDPKEQSAFLRVILPKHELVVGELVPVEVKAYFRAGVSASLNGLPVLNSDAFALNKLSDHADQTRETINGATYTVVTWTSSLSAVKAGDYPLNLDLPVMLRVKERGQRRGGGRNPLKDFFGDDSPFGGSLFDDSFFDDFFAQAIEKPLTLHTDGDVVKISVLPAKGRPVSFSGAVGRFDVSSEVSSASGATGDPLTLKMTITGSGNFSRVATNGLPASANWKSYKPNAHFDAAGSGDLAGTKIFEQSIVPTKAGAQKIPAIGFSYFDPEIRAYVTKTTEPIAVDITKNTATPAASAPVAKAADAPTETADGLAPDEVVPAQANASLQPLVLRAWFIGANAAMLAALLLGAIYRGLRGRRSIDPEQWQREAAAGAVNGSLAAMEAAVRSKDAPRFFDAARHALQEQLAARWHIPASRVTLPEIRTRLNGHGDEVRAVFQAADEIAYSGRSFTAPDLQRWHDLVKNQVHELARK